MAGMGHMALALTGPWLSQGLGVVVEEGVEELLHWGAPRFAP